MHDIVPVIVEALLRGERVALASVVERRGSLPMAGDASMIVHADGTTMGTIGGGCLEAEVYGVARRLLESGGASIDRFNLTEVEEGLGGHVCGGSVGILTRALEPDGDTLATFELLARAVEAADPVAVVSSLPPAEGGEAPPSASPPTAVCQASESARGDAADLPEQVAAAARAALRGGATQSVRLGDRAWVVEPLPARPHVVIFGAGHCGRAIGESAARVGFRVSVLEDRQAFLDPELMPWAAELRHVSFEAIGAALPPRDDLYLVIVTRGHEHDLDILRQIHDRPCAYLGMIGSERKRHLFLRTLREEGASARALEGLASPMGLAIGADSPEEIAVAVVAELIAVRRRVDLPAELRSGRSSRRPARLAAAP